MKEGCTIITDIYFKETDAKNYLNFQSCHPKHTKRSIPYNLARRICTIVSNDEIKKQRLEELKTSLIKRNYPISTIEKGIEMASKIPRDELLKPNTNNKNENIIAYVSTHNPKNTEAFNIIKQNENLLKSDPTMETILNENKMIKSKRQPPNLKKILTRAEFSENNNKQNFKVSTCKRSNCILCQFMPESDSYNFNGKIFYVNTDMDCNVQNVLYVMTCAGCKKYYIGQTGGKLRTRRTIHAQQIKDPSVRQLWVSHHIDNCCKKEPKFQIFPFFKINNNSVSARLAKETYFIKIFKPELNRKNC